MNEEIKKLVETVNEEQLDWFEREPCDLHECPLNDGTCRVHDIQKTKLWNGEGCKIAKIILNT